MSEARSWKMFSKLEWKSVDNFKGLINWVAMSSNEGLTLKTSALEFLHVGQFTLWTQSIKLSLFCNNPPPPPAQCLRFSGNYPTFILNFLTKSVTTSDTWWCRFYEEEKSNRGKEKSRKGLHSKNIETLDVIVTSSHNFHVYIFTSVSFRPQTPPLLT